MQESIDLFPQLMQITSILGALLLATVLLLFGFKWWYKRKWSSPLGPSHLQLCERMPLSPKTTLFLIQAGGKKVLLAESSEEVCVLGEPATFHLGKSLSHPPALPVEQGTPYASVES